MATITDLPFEMLSITAADSGLIITDLPIEILSNIAADSGLTNRDRKQACLTCTKLANAMTPIIFRRVYLSRLKTDRDGFLTLAATPHLAAHVEEIIWFELETFKYEKRLDVQLHDGRNVNLFEAARDIFWLPAEPKIEQNRGYDGKIVNRNPPPCVINFLAQFRAAVARMPKLHTFASRQMDPRRTVCLVDGFPFEVGLLMSYRCKDEDWHAPWSDFLYIFLETIAEEKGRINKLHCGDELSASLARIDPRYHAAMPYLISLELSISYSVFQPYDHKLDNLRNAMYKATELRELSLSLDCNSEFVRWVKPLVGFHRLMVQGRYRYHRWKHLRSLKFRAIYLSTLTLLRMIEPHVSTLRHLHLDQCRPGASFARELSELDGLHLDSITISDGEIPKSGLVSEQELLRFIHGEDVGDKRVAKKIGKGKFVTHNRRTDNIDDEEFEDPEADLDNVSDHSSEWWSDTDSDSVADTTSASQGHAADSDCYGCPTHRRRRDYDCYECLLHRRKFRPRRVS